MDNEKDTQAILEAEACRSQGDMQGMFLWIQKGLEHNYRNYELYFMLGEYYLETNPYQSYLCFENAEFYCSDKEDLRVISQAKQQLADAGFAVPPVSVVILSYNAREEMILCLDSLRQYGGAGNGCEIIVVDNASTDGITDYLKEQEDVRLFCNDENIGFPTGCNQGIKMSNPYNDIFLLNNDTVVTPNAIFWLRMGLYEDPSVGGTGSVTNYAGNHQIIDETFGSPDEYIHYAIKHNIPLEYPYEKRLSLIGFAFMIKRQALDTVGLLDERFSPGNYEDDDLSCRIIEAGYQLLLCRNSFIYHFGSRSFRKDAGKYVRLMRTNAGKFKDKWGFDNSYYKYERRELTAYIKEEKTAQLNILEIGCGLGATLGYIQNRYPNARVYGIELEGRIAHLAQKYIPSIRQGNIETMLLDYPENFFDYIIFADVLEHLHDPQKELRKLQKYLKDSGFILASIPNILHSSVILNLLRGRFTYEEAGILDRTHLRFFTVYEIWGLFQKSGYAIEEIRRVIAANDMSEEDRAMYDALLRLPGIVSEEELQTYQYLIRAGKAI